MDNRERQRSRKAAKHTVIAIYSSSDEEEEESISQESQNYDPSSDHSLEEISSSTSCDDDNDEENEGKDEGSMCNRVVHLQEQSDLEELTLVECKAYLRRHRLRLSGSRAECIWRIQEHWRLKNGSGERLYPRSSFTINCTGDVCRGDVVLFTQKVFKKNGSLLGKRTVAGGIVKESYGAAKQQHTFTVEVLWSKGIKKLPPLYPLLVKGRNLYKMKTFRQLWENEKERSLVLAEKHKRGAAARLIRDVRRTKAIERTKNISSANEGGKHQKHIQHHRPSRMSMESEAERGKCAKERGKTQIENKKCNYYYRNTPAFRQSNFKESTMCNSQKYHLRHQILMHPYEVGESSLQPYDYLHQPEQHHQKEPYSFSSARSWPTFGSSSSSVFIPASAHQEFVNCNNQSRYERDIHATEWRRFNNSFLHGERGWNNSSAPSQKRQRRN